MTERSEHDLHRTISKAVEDYYRLPDGSIVIDIPATLSAFAEGASILIASVEPVNVRERVQRTFVKAVKVRVPAKLAAGQRIPPTSQTRT